MLNPKSPSDQWGDTGWTGPTTLVIERCVKCLQFGRAKHSMVLSDTDPNGAKLEVDDTNRQY
jgi:uncharacterized protein YerC